MHKGRNLLWRARSARQCRAQTGDDQLLISFTAAAAGAHALSVQRQFEMVIRVWYVRVVWPSDR